MGNAQTLLSHKDAHKHSLLENDVNVHLDHANVNGSVTTGLEDAIPNNISPIDSDPTVIKLKKKPSLIQRLRNSRLREKSLRQDGKGHKASSRAHRQHGHRRLSSAGTNADDDSTLGESSMKPGDKHRRHLQKSEEDDEMVEEVLHTPTHANNLLLSPPSPSPPPVPPHVTTIIQGASGTTVPNTMSSLEPPDHKNGLSPDHISQRGGPRFSNSSYGPDAYSDDDVFPNMDPNNESASKLHTTQGKAVVFQRVGTVVQRGFVRMRQSFRSLRHRGPHTWRKGNDPIAAVEMVPEDDGMQPSEVPTPSLPPCPTSLEYNKKSETKQKSNTAASFFPRVAASLRRRRQRMHSSTADDAAMLSE